MTGIAAAGKGNEKHPACLGRKARWGLLFGLDEEPGSSILITGISPTVNYCHPVVLVTVKLTLIFASIKKSSSDSRCTASPRIKFGSSLSFTSKDRSVSAANAE